MSPAALLLVPDETGLAPLFGIPSARRLARIAGRLGVTAIHVLAPPDTPREAFQGTPALFHAASGPEAAAEAVRSLGLPEATTVLLVRADLVWDRRGLAGLLAEAASGGPRRVQAHGAPPGDGAYVVPAALAPEAARYLWAPGAPGARAPAGVREVGAPGPLPVVMGPGAEGVRRAEDALVSSLAAATHADDGFMARHVDRPVSRFISRRVAATGIAPNTITLIGVAIGLSGAFFLSLPGYAAHLFGALLFLACVVVDGVDGEVARLALKESRFGHYLDIVTDNLVHAAVFAGMAYGVYHDTGNTLWLGLLWVLLGGAGASLAAAGWCIFRKSAGEFARSPRIIRLLALLANRDFAYLVAGLALFGKVHWFLAAAAAGSWIFAGAVIALFMKERRDKKRRAPEPPRAPAPR